MRSIVKTSIAWGMGAIILGAATLYVHRVDNSLSTEDKQYIPRYLQGIAPLPEDPTYEEELAFIISVQRSVLKVAPKNEGLPFDQRREPKELCIAQTGLCYDRSRVIEKILMYSGFETRHVAVYSKKGSKSSLRLLAPAGPDSHSITEVLTRNGWLVVDSNAPWVSTDRDLRPRSIKEMQSSANASEPVQWSLQPAPIIYRVPFISIYGLYSRHGRFYPPYDFIPDINYGEFVQNIW